MYEIYLINIAFKFKFIQGVFYKPNGSLYFNKVDESHTGSYSCTPYNELGTDGPSPLIHVIVQKPPIITVKPKPLYIYKLGDNVTFPCDARDKYNYQRPQILWMRVGQLKANQQNCET